MSIKPYNILLLFTAFLMKSCSEPAYHKETLLFAGYLQKHFHVPIARDSTNYILVSEYGCDGCIRKTINRGSLNINVRFIISKNGYERFFGNIKTNWKRALIDSTDEINRIPFHQGNVAILQTANQSIYNIIKLESYNADSLLAVYIR